MQLGASFLHCCIANVPSQRENEQQVGTEITTNKNERMKRNWIHFKC